MGDVYHASLIPREELREQRQRSLLDSKQKEIILHGTVLLWIRMYTERMHL